MTSPATDHEPRVTPSNSRLWSAAREKQMTFVRDTCFWIGFAGFAGMLTGAILPNANMAMWNAPLFILGIATSLWAAMQLKAMEPNRPHFGAQGLTRWRLWPHFQLDFDCACGRRLTFENVPFTASKSDPGGGRYSVICPDEACRQGHYKYGLAGGEKKGWQ